MNDQKRNYLPVNQSKLFDVNKRFFDRPVEVKAMLHKADSLGVWPAEGETVRILKRLSEIEDIFWEKRYQPLDALQKYVREAWELSVELTTLETELNSNNRKAPAVCATISFTGLVNIFVISVTTRQLVVTQPWKDEAEKVRNALGIENFAENLGANDKAALEIDQNMVVDNEVVVSNEGIVLDKVDSTESIQGLENVRISRKTAKNLKKRLEGEDTLVSDQNVWQKQIEVLEFRLQKSEKRYDKTLESFENQMIQLNTDSVEEARSQNQRIGDILKAFEECKEQVARLAKKVAKSPKKDKETYQEVKVLKAKKDMLKVTKMSLPATSPKRIVIEDTFENVMSRPVLTGEGDKVDKVVSPKEVKGVAKAEASRKIVSRNKYSRLKEKAGTSKSGEIVSVSLDKSQSSGRRVSIPDLEKLDSQRAHPNVSDDSITLGIDEEMSEFDRELLQAESEKQKLEEVELKVRAEETAREAIRQKGIDKMKITRKGFVKQQRLEREARKTLAKSNAQESVKDRLGEKRKPRIRKKKN